MNAELNRAEKKVIAALYRIANKWPESLWLYSASGRLNVMKKSADGKRIMVGDGYSPEGFVAFINIENDGGDW